MGTVTTKGTEATNISRTRRKRRVKPVSRSDIGTDNDGSGINRTLGNVQYKKEYPCNMIGLMEWHTGQKYPDKNHEFSNANLLSITANSFLRFLNLMAYDEEYPAVDAVPVTRSTNIE